ncbi:unnamed protein product [Candida verbasci]|uniref:Flavin-containing monooxygenase n=1 Tax=Candida verbasci TaxID=1227364 RepID=A0A9W4TWL1_9ASCO|nr:unnamed protein product [Candida verbasci]
MTIDKEGPKYDRIAIIGGGPAGLAAAKALAYEPINFKTIDLYERRDKLGGLWYHHGDKTKLHPSVPSVNQYSREMTSEGALKEDIYTSAIYKYMETNIVYPIMEYNQVYFPRNSRIYPLRQSVLDYIEEYIKSMPESVNFNLNSNIISVEKVNDVWQVKVEDEEVKEYDAVVIANGHFNTPYIPDVPGLKEWNEHLSNTISHSKYYQSPNDYKNKTVLVIGNAASGVDLSTQISTVAKKVYVSVRDKSKLTLKNSLIDYIGMVEEYNHTDKSVITRDGETVNGIDSVIFCTGYFYSFPFLKLDNILTDGRQVQNIYKQIFNIQDPSISFVALLKNFLPMPVSEYQSSLIARVYSGRYKLPNEEEMKEDYEIEMIKKGKGSPFHDFSFPKDIDYCEHLKSLIETQNCLQSGLIGPLWTKEKIYYRSQTKIQKEERLRDLIEHVKQLRKEGKDFSLLN